MMGMDEPVPFAAELTVARRAAADAAAYLVAARGSATVREKGRGDLITEVDEAAERLIVDRLRRHFPADRILAEESASGLFEAGTRTWIIDPIDGTTNFVHDHPFACVSIAMADEQGLAVGVIHAPFLREVYHAARGSGAFLNELPLQVSEVSTGPTGLYATGFPFKEGKGDPELYFRLVAEVVGSSHGVRRAGSAALDCAYVAAGRVDGYFEIGVSAWDVAAGLLLVSEAGGRVSGWPGDVDPPLRTGRVLATNGRVHEWLEERVGRAGL